jgi:AraC-type DNA-binding domain-containing proteins
MNKNIKYCHVREDDERSFHFDYVHIKWNEQISFHQSDTWELSYVIKGSGTRVVGNTVEVFSNGEVIFIPPNIPHGWYFDEFDHDEEGKIENITIIFDDKLINKCASDFPEVKPVIEQLHQYKEAVKFKGETLKLLQRIMTSMVNQSNPERLASFIQLLYKIAISSETRVVGSLVKQNKSAEKMQEVSRFMVHNSHRKISLDEVAQYVGMNRSSFCTFYKREKGKSFFSALNEYRIECSCLMLRETAMSIADICYATGFEDVPYYNRTFKKLKGESPKDYRTKFT